MIREIDRSVERMGRAPGMMRGRSLCCGFNNVYIHNNTISQGGEL